jgi:uncharacterized phage protein gp47/JayE
MPSYKTLDQIVDSVLADMQAADPEANPYVKGSFLMAQGVAVASNDFDFQAHLKELYLQSFPDTSTGEFAIRWGALRRTFRNPNTASTGPIAITGTLDGKIVPALSTLVSKSGAQYTTRFDTTLTYQSVVPSALTRVGTTAYMTVNEAIPYANGMSITVTGATPAEYNGTFPIIITGDRTITYVMTSDPGGDASVLPTSVVSVKPTGAATVDSVLEGADQNAGAGETVTFAPTIADVDADAIVMYGEISGGADIETEASFTDRRMSSWRNPARGFSPAAVKAQAKTITGTTRVWVERATPAAGQVTVYFVRDLDTSIFPTSTAISEMKAKLLEIAYAPVAEVDVIVAAPSSVAVDFTFTALSPNTSEMRTAVENNLKQFFRTATVVGVDVPLDALRAAIYSAYQKSDGTKLQSFAISAPAADVTVPDGYLASLGAINFNF